MINIREHLTFFEASLLYIYLGVILTRIFSVPLIIKSLLALPIFFLLPFLAGVVLLELLNFLFKNKMQNLLVTGGTSYYVLCLLTGIFFTEFIAVVLQILNITLLLKNIGYLMVAMTTFCFLYLRFSNHNILRRKVLGANVKKHVVSILFIFSFSIVSFLIKTTFVNPPLTTWSSWTLPIPYVQAVLRLLNSGFFDVTQRWVEIFFTATSCQLFNISHPEFFSYAGTLLVTAMFSLGTYVLAYKFSSNVAMSLLCAVLSIFLNVPIGFHEVPVYHFKSNTILISLSPWIMLLIIDFLKKRENFSLKNAFAVTMPTVLFFTSLAILSSSVGVGALYSSGISYEVQYAIIRPVIIISIPLAILFVHFFLKRKDTGVLATILLACTVLYTIHPQDSLLYISAIVLLVFIFYVMSKRRGHTLLRITSLLIFLVIFLAWNNIISIPAIPTSAVLGYEPSTLDSFLVKKLVFSDGNALITRYFFVLGLAALIFSQNRKDLIALGILTITFLIYFFPDYWTNRALAATTPFMAYAISTNLKFISRVVSSMFNRRNKTKFVITCILVSLILVAITPGLLNPIYTKFSRFPGSRLAPYEYDAAVWLRDNTSETEVILSDYWTMMLLNPISNKIWLTDRQFMYDSLDQKYKDLLAELNEVVFKASSSLEVYTKIQTLAKDMREGIDWTEKYYCNSVGINPKNITFIIVLSSRTVKWLETGNMDIMEPQYSPVNPKYLAIFNDTRYFTLLTQVPEQIYVFRVKL